MSAPPQNLPIQLSSFIGREREIAEVKRLLGSVRLVTLTGSGGTGKTRLALQAADEILNQFTDGVWFVELAPLSDPTLVPVAIATALGVQQEQGRPLLMTVLVWLRPKQLLLILDNCEHLIEACAQFADAALRTSRDIRILATSREPLGIAGETAYRVPSLANPAPSEALRMPGLQLTQFSAIQLFCERAAQSLTTFMLTDADAFIVAQICYRLDGIPLAIELAAARVKVLSVEQIAERLDDRFRLLTGGSRTALPRQQTLRGAIDWSHSLIPQAEQTIFRRLAVFAGGWTLEAAESVCAGNGVTVDAILDLLTHLVDKSLVEITERSSRPRYRMLETIRQYAREKLLDAGESDTLRDRHLKFYFDMVERAEPLLVTAQRTEWLPRLEADLDNLRAALEWACERDLETARQLAGDLRGFWLYADRMSEGVAWFERLLGPGTQQERTKGRALVLLGAGTGFSEQFPNENAKALLGQSVAIFRVLGDTEKLAQAVILLALAHAGLGDYEGACVMFEANEDLIRRFVNPAIQARALSQWARAVAIARNDKQKAVALFEESLAIGRQQKDPIALGLSYTIYGLWSLHEEDYAAAWRCHMEAVHWLRRGRARHPLSLAVGYAADVANLRNDREQAHSLYAEALGYSRALGNQLYTARLLGRLAYLAVREGATEQAVALFKESLAICRERNAELATAECLAGYAELRHAQGQSAQSVRVLAAPVFLPLRSPTGNPFNHIAYQRTLNAARAQLDLPAFDAAWAEGSALTLEEAIAEAQREPVDASPAPSATTPADNSAGLSAREVEVLQLLAAGLTNSQIAERLTLSPYTVQAHLRSIYSKLGVTTRVAAARAAAQFKQP